MRLDELVIKELGMDSYEKGKTYNKYYVKYLEEYRLVGASLFKFLVESQSYNTYYHVNIIASRNEILRKTCTCPQYRSNYSTCKHIAACMLLYSEKIFGHSLDPMKLSDDILKSFYNERSLKNDIKEELKLNLEFDFSNDTVSFKIYVGLEKTYIIKTESKFEDFMKVYRNGGKYMFGVKFTYDSNKHFFNEQDENILDFLYQYNKNRNKNNYYHYGYYERNNPFELNQRELDSLFGKMKNKTFSIKRYGKIKDIQYKMPTMLHLDKREGQYELSIDDIDNYQFLDSEYKYVVYNHVLFVIPSNYSQMLLKMYENDIDKLIFTKKNIQLFKDGLLRKIKDNINISEEIDDIVLSGKPEISLYFDLLKDKINCKIELNYRGNIINYFDSDNKVFRDYDCEDKVINDLLVYNFKIEKDKIYLDKIEDVVYFLDKGLSVLLKKYKVFTTKKIENMKIIKKGNVTSTFSIGKDGIMSYNFSTDAVKLEELNSVLSSLKNKQRYYKLKSGDILDLEENEELKELNNIISDLNLSKSAIASGSVEIPKYRAFYIDSLKQNKYHSINTSSSFDRFIANFKKYKNLKINFDPKDEETLRDYQKDGVRWLYTLYKCDLGGILADEMGLGKSIQTICFIKQILKEKENAKIIIVCPTSLVYNWKREFDKFAPELKYITVAENKEKRLEIINNMDDYNIFITSYGLIRNDNDEYEKINFELCVIDEAQAIKNYQAGMTKEVKKIKARTKIALTGTPIENSVLELWSIFDFIMPGYLNTIQKFRENYGIKDVDEKSLEKLTDLNYLIKPFLLRRRKDEVSKELPEKIENNIYLELPDIQKALYLKVLKETQKEMDELIKEEGFQKARFKILQLLMKLRQICVEPSVLYENYTSSSIKMERLLETVKDLIENHHKILIFSSFKRVIDKVKNMLDQEGISSYVISGEVKSKTRMELVDKFNKNDTNCFLITLKSGGTGLNLTGADIVIHLDIWWNPQVENQATDRAHRIGQKKNVTVIKLITKGTIEERIIELQNKKKILSNNLIEGKNDSELLSTISENEMKSLLSYSDEEI